MAKYSGKVEIEFFPSRNELITLIDHFLIDNAYPKNYKLINQDNHIIFIFNDSDIAYEVSIRLKKEQLYNPIYHLIRVSLSITPTSNYYVKLKASDKLNLLINKTAATFEIKNQNRRDSSKLRMRLSKHDSMLLQSEPYLSANDIQNINNRKNKLKWINHQGFNSYIGLSTSNKNYVYPNYVMKTPSQPPVNYAFKEVNKKKWITDSTFK